MEDFVTVKKSRRRKNNKNNRSKSIMTIIETTKLELMSTTFIQDTRDKVNCAVKEISSKYKMSELQRQTDDLQPDIDWICYGLGNFVESYIARYQLALLLALRTETEGGVFEVYDPMFTSEEKEILLKLNCRIPEENQEGKYRCPEDRITIFYMPHCGKALYNNVVWRNWGQASLQNVIIIGNSFNRMIDSTPSRILSRTANYIMKVQPYIQEVELECPSDLESIFNDTGIHTFNTRAVPEELWEEVEEPVYDCEDAEIIFASKVI